MDVTPLIKRDAQVIQSYNDGCFRVSGAVYDGAILVFSDRVVGWDIDGFSGISEQNFQPLIDISDDIDVVLLGCGAKMQFLEIPLRNALKAQGLSVDVMDTGAACRTYNVLLAEGRRVVAALFPV